MWNLLTVIFVVLLLVVPFLFNEFFGFEYERFGLLPRSSENWYHIAFAPFIHGSAGHLVNNCMALMAFGLLTIVRSRALFWWSSIVIVLLGGAMVWLVGRDSYHIGASGWIYGLWALTMGIAWYDRKLKNIVLGLAVLVLYGGMSWGLLPLDPSVSFEMHVAGAITGVLCAYVYTRFRSTVA